MTMPPLVDLAVFMALVMVLSLYGLAVSGHFPEEHRAPVFRQGAGAVILWSTLGLGLLMTVATLMFAWQRLPLYAAVIGGGGMLLAAPLVLQPFPDSFVNGRRALLLFSGSALALLFLTRTLG